MKHALSGKENVTNENYDIYVMDELAYDMEQQMIDEEVNDLSHLADDDDHGDNDGDEGY